jgi:regulator of protease activity HflC (stomatin/prohibitin superfamily)
MTTVPFQRVRRAAKAFLTVALLLLAGYVGVWQWTICRTEVPPGYSLLVRYKGPWPFGSSTMAPEGTLVQNASAGQPVQVGILEAMPGPGRHFYSPLEYEARLVKDEVILPGKVGVLVSKIGKPLPEGAYLVDAKGYRGILRTVLTPGRYRINTYAYDVKVVDIDACAGPSTRLKRTANDPALIPPGYVGVVTNKASNPSTGENRGIQQEILQPGIYFLNPEEKRIDIISIGYSETSLTVEARKQDAAAATAARAHDLGGDRLGTSTPDDPFYVAGKGIEFPSSDGFPIHLDYTAIWGILPAQAPNVVRQFGTLKDVEHKVILPQIESICRMHGSRRGAVDLLVGDTREQFQDETSAELERVLSAKNLSLLFGLTRHIYVPKLVREPIQKAKIADELTKTRDQEQLTAQAQAELTEAKAKVVFGEKRTRAETEKKVAEVGATGAKKASEIAAETEKFKAEIDAKSAVIDAQTTRVLGEAKAKSVKLAKEAKAERSQLLVKAMGGPAAYERYIFAEGLPPDLKVGIFYAGPGTLWTDLKGFEQTMLGKLVSETPAAGALDPQRTATRNGPDKSDSPSPGQ